MENNPGIPSRRGLGPMLLRAWFALTRRKIRLLHGGEAAAAGPALYAVGHPAGFLHALVLALELERPVHCLLPGKLARGPFARFLARQMGIMLYEGDSPAADPARREGLNVLAGGGALVVFADDPPAGPDASGTLAASAAQLVERAEAQHAGHRVAVHPVHLFLPESSTRSRETLIYVGAALPRDGSKSATPPAEGESLSLAQSH